MQDRNDRNPLIYNYLKRFQENPRSRIFAPLAEAYRKSGLVDEAIDIAREGLQYHPKFVGGRVALARALFDKKEFLGVLEELKEIVQEVPDNLVAQRLYAESCLMLGRIADALTAYKLLLYFQPSDQEIAKVVFELEAQAYKEGALVLETDAPLAQMDGKGPNLLNDSNDFKVAPAAGALLNTQPVSRHQWMQRIELLQSLLQRVERYRSASKD